MDVDLVVLQDALCGVISGAIAASPAIGLESVTAVMAARDRDAAYDYIVLGAEEYTDRSTDCGDAGRLFVPLDVWTEEQGRTRCKTICGALKALLDDNLFAVPGHEVTACWHRRTRIFDDPKPGVRHGVVEFDIEVSRVS